MRDAIAMVRSQLGREYDLVIGGKRIRTAEKIVSINPANPSEVIGIHQKAGPSMWSPRCRPRSPLRKVAVRFRRRAHRHALPHGRHHPQAQVRVQRLAGARSR
jgi:hypothetical protein